MLNKEFINLYKNISALANYFVISPIIPSSVVPAVSTATFFVFIISLLFALKAFNKY